MEVEVEKLMTTQDLRVIIEQVQKIIEINKKIATFKNLDVAKKTINVFRGQDGFKEACCKIVGADIDKFQDFLDTFNDVVNLEYQIVANHSDDKMNEGLEKLKRRPLILRMIAAIL